MGYVVVVVVVDVAAAAIAAADDDSFISFSLSNLSSLLFFTS